MKKLIGLLRLMRPANIITAVADILAGIAIAGFVHGDYSFHPVLMLVLSTACLYGGGVVMNDYFDAALDKLERPERPIPSGIVSKSEAAALGMTLFLTGIVAAFFVSAVSGMLAAAITFFALLYDKWGKHLSVGGPVNMGLCRGLNLLLGISIVPLSVGMYWYLAVIPVVYIGAVTMISRGEVHGSRKRVLYAAAVLYVIVMGSVLYMSISHDALLRTLCFILIWGVFVFPPLKRAINNPEGKMVGKAVKAGVIALILMNASWAAAFGMIYMAFTILLLLPVSLIVAKAFAVT